MADGSHTFNFPGPQQSRLRPGEIVVDLFAGGGGASEALKQALGIDPALAYNHDEWAIGMHAANHPLTIHHREDIWHADPVRDVAGRPVGWFHFSPDCTHFSQAKGGQPRSRKIRALAWVGVKWIGQLARVGLAPRILSMENVWQMLTWGPLVAKRCRKTGRVVKMDGTVAARGERVPVANQQLVPDKQHAGRTWKQFVAALRSYGYTVEWRKLDASMFGAGTDRERLFLIARRDGEPIQWPQPTHGGGLLRMRSAADAIDWNVLGASIFTRKRPLKPNTIRRLLDGARRGGWPQPYIDALVALREGREPRLDITAEEAADIARRMGHRTGLVMATGGGGVARQVDDQVPTITTGGNGAAPHFLRPVILHRNASEGGRSARPVDEPLPTILTGGAGNLVEPVLQPVLMGTQGSSKAKPVSEPMATITTGGAANSIRPGCARPQLFEPIVAPYYGSGSGTTGQPCSAPLPTVTTKARFGLVEPVVVSTCNSSSAGVRLAGAPLRTITTARGGDMALGEPVVMGYRIDILYRMLFERELFNAQGFPPDYIIERTADGRRITRTQAIRMVGNSVSPPPLAALARANLDPATKVERMAA
jgi:DNA (cytosine-5)-methyltransferase 1